MIHIKGLNQKSNKETNRSSVLKFIRRYKDCSRSDISRAMGLERATITNIINDLIKWELIVESRFIKGKDGRRSIGLKLSEKYGVVGVRLSRHYFSIGLFSLNGKQYLTKNYPIKIFENAEIVLSRLEKSIRSFLIENSNVKILGIGIALPGPFLKYEGRIALMSEFPGWEKISLENELKLLFNIPIHLEHDAKAGAFAEWNQRSHALGETMVYIAAGQGIGAGIIIDGKIFAGSLGIAGEIGHMSINFNGQKCSCNNHGCLEQYCSTISLERQARKEIKDYPDSLLNQNCDFLSIVDAYKNNDKFAISLFLHSAKFLSIAIANIVNIINPDLIVLGDEMSMFGEDLLYSVKKGLKKLILPILYKKLNIELSKIKSNPELIGASDLIVDKVLSKPSKLKKML